MKYKDLLKWVQDLQEGLDDRGFKKLLDTPVLLNNNVTIEQLTAIKGKHLPAGVQPVMTVAVKRRRSF